MSLYPVPNFSSDDINQGDPVLSPRNSSHCRDSRMGREAEEEMARETLQGAGSLCVYPIHREDHRESRNN